MASQTHSASSTTQNPENTTNPGLNINLDVAETISALLWPLIVITIILIFRRKILETAPKIIEALSSLAKKIKKVEISGFSVEFAEVKPLELKGSDLIDPHKAQKVFNSLLFKKYLDPIKTEAKYDYTLIDLGSGKEWLTSRLYVWSILLERAIGTKALVFVETLEAKTMRYIGWSEPSKVRWSLAKSENSYLEKAYAQAYQQIISENAEISDDKGGIISIRDGQPTNLMLKLAESILSDSRIQTILPIPCYSKELKNPESQILINEYLEGFEKNYIDGAKYIFEHAYWLNSSKLISLLSDSICSDSIRLESFQKLDVIDQFSLIMETPQKYIAITQNDGVFERFIDRDILLQKMAEEISKYQ